MKTPPLLLAAMLGIGIGVTALLARWHGRPSVDPPAPLAMAAPTTRQVPSPAPAGPGAGRRPEATGPTTRGQVPGAATPLQAILDAAMTARDPEDRAEAMRLSAMCVTEATLPPMTARGVLALNGSRPIDAARVLAEVRDARRQLTQFCGTGRALTFVDDLRKAGRPAVDPISRALILWHGGRGSQAYFQAVTEVLARPGSYPAQFDLWLEQDLDDQLVDGASLTRNQALYVEDALHAAFIADDAEGSIRRLRRCAEAAACPDSTQLAPAELGPAQAAASRLSALIRQQRWDLLVPGR